MEYGCIGERLKHSFSKEIHNALADYDYQLMEIQKEELEGFMLAKNFKAINVTIPYKGAVIPYLYYIDDIASEIGAINTVINKNGRLYGYNTDFYGMSALINKSGISLKDKKVLILGSGGTSKTAFAVAKYLNAREIYRLTRSEKEGLITYQEAYIKHTDADIIINTTPVGMYPDSSGTPIDISKFQNLSGVVDVVYNPLKTRLVVSAQNRGIKAVGGLYMLVAQAVSAVEKFLDTEIQPPKIDTVYKNILHSKQNIVLIGMAGCGKSTIGDKLAKETGREFIDTDALIVEREQQEITEIFKTKGEQGFRKIETEVISELAPLGGKIIATGGGAVLNPENVDNLRQNGKIYFLDRPLENIVATKDRPLSSNQDDLKKRFYERYDKYLSAADKRLKITEDPNENTQLILKDFLV